MDFPRAYGARQGLAHLLQRARLLTLEVLTYRTTRTASHSCVSASTTTHIRKRRPPARLSKRTWWPLARSAIMRSALGRGPIGTGGVGDNPINIHVNHSPVINAVVAQSVKKFYKISERQMFKQKSDVARRGMHLGLNKLDF